MSIVVSVVALLENVFLIVRGPLLKLMFNSPGDSDGGLPWIFGTFERFLEPDSTASRSVRHHVTPLIMKGLLLEMYFHLRLFYPLRGFLFIEYLSCEFLCCRTICHMQTMTFKECKAYVCLEVLKFVF